MTHRLVLLWIAAHIGVYTVAISISALLIGALGWLGVPVAILGTIALVSLAQWSVLHMRFTDLAALRWIGVSVTGFLIGLGITLLITIIAAACSLGMTGFGRGGGDYMPFAMSQLLSFVVNALTIAGILVTWGSVAHAQWRILNSSGAPGRWIWYTSSIIGNSLAMISIGLLIVLSIRGVQSSGPLDFTLIAIPSYFLLGVLFGTIAGTISGAGLWFTLRPQENRSASLTP